MSNTQHYTFITAYTAAAALERTKAALDHMTGGHINEVLELVREYNELSDINKEIQDAKTK